MDSLCSSIGVSKRTIYQKVESKGKLVHVIFNKDMAEFRQKTASIQKNSTDAIHETLLLFDAICEKQNKISDSTISDLKNHYQPLWHDFTKSMGQHVEATFSKNIQEGICQRVFSKDVNPWEVAHIVSRYFGLCPDKSFTYCHADASLLNFIDYHFNSICNRRGKELWEKLKDNSLLACHL